MAEDETRGECELCRQPTIRKCSGCKLVFYCSPEHEREHLDRCKSYEVGEVPEFGKYLMAARDLARGDVIFTEVPLVVGPQAQIIEEGPIPCVGCCRQIEAKYCERCPECLWPACASLCPGLRDISRHGAECRVLKLNLPTVMTYTPDTLHKLFRWDILAALRALFLQRTSKPRWLKLLNLKSHQDKRGVDTELYKSVDEKVRYLQETFLTPLKKYEEETGTTILADTSSDLLHRLFAILDANSWEVNEDNVEVSLVYANASSIEHSCVPNVAHSIGSDKENFRITLSAAVAIRQGERLSSTYTNILWGTHARRKHLKTVRYFSCGCRRCRDPTELGTFFSALRCLGAEGSPCGGTQLPVNPLERSVQWVCDRCEISLPAKEIMGFVEHLGVEVRKVMTRRPSVEELEELLEKLDKFLHPNHFHVYAVKHSLVQMYSSRFAEEVELSDNFLREKLEMCQSLAAVTRALDPGLVRLGIYLGVILHEMFEIRFSLLTRRYEAGMKESFRREFQEISNIVGENKEALRFELTSSTGRTLMNVAVNDESKFQSWKQENSLVD